MLVEESSIYNKLAKDRRLSYKNRLHFVHFGIVFGKVMVRINNVRLLNNSQFGYKYIVAEFKRPVHFAS